MFRLGGTAIVNELPYSVQKLLDLARANGDRARTCSAVR